MPLSFLLYSKPHAFISMVTSAMLTYCNPLLSKAEWWRYYIHLNFEHPVFWNGWSYRIRNMVLRSPSLSSTYKISSKSTNQFISCTYLRSLNVCHFGMIGATGLKVGHRGHLQPYHIHTKFHPNPPNRFKRCTHHIKFKHLRFWSDPRSWLSDILIWLLFLFCAYTLFLLNSLRSLVFSLSHCNLRFCWVIFPFLIFFSVSFK
jgi:hypothetical protein